MTSVPRVFDNRKTIREGREFCALGLENNISCVPVDDAENQLHDGFFERLHIDHGLPPVPREISDALDKLESPDVLDCGHGTGEWIRGLLDMLDIDDSDGFIGIDIFDRHITGLQQFHKLPWDLNASLLNAPREYVEPERFDMINSRFLTDGINENRWEPLVKEYKRLLKPGGWLQMVEVRWRFLSRSDKALPSLTAWSDAYMNALSSMKKDPDIMREKDPNIIRRLEYLLRWSAGFERVVGRTCNIPVGNWRPEDDDDDEDVSIIRYVHGMLESFALVPFTQHLGESNMSMQRCKEVVQAAQAELRTPDADIYFEIFVVCGSKKR